jgi:pimeloyl-ACP methyl ester carboxylesterase
VTSSSVREVVLDAGDVRLSGLLATPEQPPRALVLALHGGGMRASYFHGPAHPDVSLLTLASSLGYAALALDRPGYGASSAELPDGIPLHQQATVTWAAIDAFREHYGVTAPLFAIGHSFGMKLALYLAATDRRGELVGVECSGAGVRYNSDLASHPGRAADDEVSLTTKERIELFWGTRRLYPPGTLDRANRPTAVVPESERVESALWPELLVEIGPYIRVPVRYTIADHERWWDVGDETLGRFRSILASSPRVDINRQVAAGHNISLGWTARAYHLKSLAFAEECLAGVHIDRRTSGQRHLAAIPASTGRTTAVM